MLMLRILSSHKDQMSRSWGHTAQDDCTRLTLIRFSPVQRAPISVIELSANCS